MRFVCKGEYMKELPFPNEIMIEATNVCNNKCFFCGSNASDRKRGIIDYDLMIRLINEAYLNGSRKISFHGMGEPCLCKELLQYIAEAKKVGYTYIYLDTNGVLATPEVIFPIIDAGLDSLKFSIHASTSETYKRITNNDAFEAVTDNFKKIGTYIKEEKKVCKLIGFFAESTINSKETDSFVEMFKPYATEIWIKPIHNGSGVMQENVKYAVNESVSAIKELPCVELKRMTINWEGDAIACSTDWTGSLKYGNIKDYSLKELWNCERINEIRVEHQSINTLGKICRRCMGVNDEAT